MAITLKQLRGSSSLVALLLLLHIGIVIGANEKLVETVCKRQPDLAICLELRPRANHAVTHNVTGHLHDFNRSRQTDPQTSSTTATDATRVELTSGEAKELERLQMRKGGSTPVTAPRVELSSAEAGELDRIQSSRRTSELEKELIEFTEAEEAELDKATGRVAVPVVRSKTGRGKVAYCDRYKSHFAYYCIEKVYGKAKTMDHLSVFCPTFRKNCQPEAEEVNRNPFHRFRPRTSPDFPDVAMTEHQVRTEHALEEQKRLHPCTPDCDHRVWKHCTQECKCDYLYPSVQRFCNPPPLPLFLNTCRLWYYGCPKYEQYHYSSQFVYSKAEKGKVIPGIATSRSNYYGPQYGQAYSSSTYYPGMHSYPLTMRDESIASG